MCIGTITRVTTECSGSAEFPVAVDLRQGSALISLLFVECVRKVELSEIMNADDLGTLAETEEELQRRVVERQEAWERKGLSE